MAKKRHKLSIGCHFAGVSAGAKTAAVGVVIPRTEMGLEAAENYLCNRRLTGRLEVVTGDDAAGQTTFIDDQHVAIETSFDVRRYSVGIDDIRSRITFAIDTVDPVQFFAMANKRGRILVDQVEVIPPKEQPAEEEEDAESDEE